MAGYSGTPLAKKLGIKEGHAVAAVNAPPDFADLLAPLPDGVQVRDRPKKGDNVIALFTTERAELAKRLPKLLDTMDRAGAIWVGWPKKASKVPTDITEDTVRAVALPLGLVDNKVCAIDDTWSGLRLVIRLENR